MSAIFTNEPANSTVFYDCPFSDNPCGMASRYPAGFSYASPGGAGMVSSPRVMDQFVLTGGNTGNGQWGLGFPRKREIFVGFVWRTTVTGLPNNTNKIIFIKDPSNSFLVWQGTPGSNAKRLIWYQQERVDNCHITGSRFGGLCYSQSGDGTGWFDPNINSSVCNIAPGDPFTKVEIYLKASSTNTSKDGIIKIWINGTLSTSYTNVNQGTDLNVFPGGFANVEITATWDGTIPPAPNDWHHYFDHLYVSFPNGGVVEPPPIEPQPDPTDPTPPTLPPPTGLSPNGGTPKDPGQITLSWNQVSGAIAYDLRLHKGGTPYNPCESMIFCRRQSQNTATFTADPDSTYDWWVHSVNSAGVAGDLQGAGFSVGPVVNPPEPPPIDPNPDEDPEIPPVEPDPEPPVTPEDPELPPVIGPGQVLAVVSPSNPLNFVLCHTRR